MLYSSSLQGESMPRKDRLQYPGYYHIVNRGEERRKVFLHPDDYERFMELVASMLEEFGITMHAYCLMTNHYHLLLETHEENLSEAMKYLNSNYSMYFNRKYKRTGHLWQGRFLSYYLCDEMHVWSVVKYIERNPMQAGMVKAIDKYEYQSFFQWKHNEAHFNLLKDAIIFDMTLQEYDDYIDQELEEDILAQIYTSPKIIIKDGKMEVLYKRIETFFEQDKDIDRNDNIKKAYEYGYTKTEIARLVGLSSKSISNILKKADTNSEHERSRIE